jgi:hypothetical protein
VIASSQVSLIAGNLLLIQWKETPQMTVGQPPATTNVLDGNTIGPFYYSFLQLDNNDNFNVLANEFKVPEVIVETAPGYTGADWNAGNPMPVVGGFISVGKDDLVPIVYQGNAAVTAGTTAISGQLNLYFNSTETALVTTLNSAMRCYYYSVITYMEED